MGQLNHSTIVVSVCTRHTANKIADKTLKNQQFIVYKQFNEKGKIDKKEHKTRSDYKCNPKFLNGLKCSIEINPFTFMTALA